MRLGIEGAHQFQRFAGVDQIIHDQDAGPIAHDVRVGALEHLGLATLISLAAAGVVGFHADGVHRADIQLARDDHCGRHAPAGDRHHGAPMAIVGAKPVQTPRQRAAVSVDLIPGDVKPLLMGQAVRILGAH